MLLEQYQLKIMIIEAKDIERGSHSMKRTLPKITKQKNKITITLDTRHAELLTMFLGTFSPNTFRNTINNYYSRFSADAYPALCEPHKSVNQKGWRMQDTMITGNLHFALTKTLQWEKRFPEKRVDE